MGLREEQQGQRRQRILKAAKRLIREGGAEALVMRELARRAEVSLATPYNLFSGKADILHALLIESVEQTEARQAALKELTPISRCFGVLDCAADQYTQDAAYGRALMRALWEQPDHTLTPQVWQRSISGMAQLFRQAQAAGELGDEIDPDLLAYQQFFDFLIALEGWTFGYLDDAGFKAQFRYGLALSINAACSEDSRCKARALLLACQNDLAEALEARRKNGLGRGSDA